jgi:hypothetical protein
MMRYAVSSQTYELTISSLQRCEEDLPFQAKRVAVVNAEARENNMVQVDAELTQVHKKDKEKDILYTYFQSKWRKDQQC